jgi:heterodisulfide reductase subunit C/quinone-modifying oxidoreductase subunit QmoC
MKQDPDFIRKVADEVPEVNRCYQCLTCTLGCPLASAMDLYPHEILKYVQLGDKQKVLRSSTCWICASCEACATRCPNEIPIVKLMDLLRQMAVQEGTVTEERPKVNDAFLAAIREKGRVHELSLILDLKRRTGGLFKLDKDEIRLGIEMFRHGKLKLLPTKIKETEAMKKLFSRLEKAR